MRKKIDYMLLSLLGASGLFSIISVCVIAAGCGATAGTNTPEKEADTYVPGTEVDTYAPGAEPDNYEPEPASEIIGGALEEAVQKPPSLEVIYVGEDGAADPSEKADGHNPSSENDTKEKSITLSFGNANWEVRKDEEVAESAVYCGVHPLDMDFERATIQLDPERSIHELKLDFGVKPDFWEVVSVWEAENIGNTDTYENGMTYDSTIDFKDDSYMAAWAGDYIYEIKAVWDRETYGGEAYYCFRAVCSQTEESISMDAGNVTEHSLELTITNNSEQEIEYGEAYKLEKMCETGDWENVKPVIENAGFNDIAYIVNPKSSRQIKIDWEWLYGKLPRGTYRIMINTCKINDAGIWDEIPLETTFEI